MRISRRFAAALATALIAFGAGQAARAQDVVVFAAASLTNALDEAAKLFEGQGGAHAKVSYAASWTLAKQIEGGAPADMFISADEARMDELEKAGLIATGTRRDLLSNLLVVVVTAYATIDSAVEVG